MQCWTDRCCLIFALFELLIQLCHQVQIENLERFSKWCWLDGVLQRPKQLGSTNKKSIRKYHFKTCLILIKTKESIGIFKNVCSKNSKVVFTSIQFDCFSCWKTKINIESTGLNTHVLCWPWPWSHHCIVCNQVQLDIRMVHNRFLSVEQFLWTASSHLQSHELSWMSKVPSKENPNKRP